MSERYTLRDNTLLKLKLDGQPDENGLVYKVLEKLEKGYLVTMDLENSSQSGQPYGVFYVDSEFIV